MSINMGMRAKLNAIIVESTDNQERRALAMDALTHFEVFQVDSQKFDVADEAWWHRRTAMSVRFGQLIKQLGIVVEIPAETDNVFDLVPAE